MRESLAKLETYFVIEGVLLLIYLAVIVGAVLLGVLAYGTVSTIAAIP